MKHNTMTTNQLVSFRLFKAIFNFPRFLQKMATKNIFVTCCVYNYSPRFLHYDLPCRNVPAVNAVFRVRLATAAGDLTHVDRGRPVGTDTEMEGRKCFI